MGRGAIAVLGCLLLLACGGGAGDDATEADREGAPTEAPAAQEQEATEPRGPLGALNSARESARAADERAAEMDSVPR